MSDGEALQPVNNPFDMDALIAAFEILRECCEHVWQALVDAFAPLVALFTRVWRDLVRLHLIPRQYRDTMMRRKMRRYYVSLR